MSSADGRRRVLVHQLLASVAPSPLRACVVVAHPAEVEAEFSYGAPPTQRSPHAAREAPVLSHGHVVRNGRGMGHSLDRDGFMLTSLALGRTSGADLYDPQQCHEALYPLAEEVVRREVPSSTRVLVFDHLVRDEARYARESRESPGARTKLLVSGPASGVHGDYTVRSGPMRAKQLLAPYESEARVDAALGQGFAFVNVWVPLANVERDPLGLIEWGSQRPQDVRTVSITFPHRKAEIYRVVHSDLHRWVYYPEMVPGECLLFKVMDSRADGRARFALHAAFEDPTSPASAPGRESIELRCLVLFGDLPQDFAPSFIAPHLAPNSLDDIETPPDNVEIGPISDEW